MAEAKSETKSETKTETKSETKSEGKSETKSPESESRTVDPEGQKTVTEDYRQGWKSIWGRK